MKGQVKVWSEDIVLPTYGVGKPEKNPMFLEKRIYQGSSGVVYPNAIIEKIYDEKEDKTYHALFLENAYLKIMVLPELGGRIQMAFDKTKQRHFIYYNQVIKPALVGLTGPWISGGIEFNWPQHHRPSTFEAVDFTIEEKEDGSKTIWINEVEKMFHTKGMTGFTLYPDKAYIEVQGRLYNRTPFPQTFLWWANPAVKVNDHYQSIFPPDVYAVFDHGRRDVSSFPIAKGVYYKVDYSPGTDISWYKNIAVPTSYMAVESKYNFIGGYEWDSAGGLLHVADHHISPGKKQWTWGHGEFGRAWDKNLTDEDGPYIELMTGVFTDNQPDFSWIQPYEEKSFVQYFMPYQQIGVVKNATKEAAVSLELKAKEADIKLYVTSPCSNIKISLEYNGKEVFEEMVTCSPEDPYLKKVTLKEAFLPESAKLIVTDLDTKKVLVSYQQEKFIERPFPLPAEAAKKPEDVESNEQLFLTGQHIEQYRHATYIATDYYYEALRRDEHDTRNNNALGLWYTRRGKFAEAESFLRKAIATSTKYNPNPYNGEPYYNLGCCLKMQGRNEEAFDAFYKSIWNDAWQHPGYLNLARIAVSKNNYDEALEFINKSLVKNDHSHTARHLKTAILRKLERTAEAFDLIKNSLTIDPFNYGCLFEEYLLLKANNDLEATSAAAENITKLSRGWADNFIEYAFDYAHAGLYLEAQQLLQLYTETHKKQATIVCYYLGWLAYKMNDTKEASRYFEHAGKLSPDYVFPNRIEDVLVLQKATELNPVDSKAYYYLGNFWYDKRQYDDAVACWEKSAAINNNFPTVFRNLSLAYYNKQHNAEKALAAMERAFMLDQSDARVLMELDQLYKRLNTPHTIRLALLEKHLPLTTSRDDLFLERVTLYNQLARHHKAKELLSSYKFHPWEGGEGKVVSQYLVCHLELARQAIEQGNATEALRLLSAAEDYPSNLGEGKLFGAPENDIDYLKGLAHDQLDKQDEAKQYYIKASLGNSEPVQAIFYNDPQPDKIFYQGLALVKLGKLHEANALFGKLVTFGQQHLHAKMSIDYFAVSLPDLLVFDVDLNLRNRIHCLYLMGLGYLGLGNGNFNKAGKLFDEVLQSDCNHQGALMHKQMMESMAAIEQ